MLFYEFRNIIIMSAFKLITFKCLTIELKTRQC